MHRLKDIREAHGLTVADLAELSGIAPSTIFRIESDDNWYKVNEVTAEALASALYKSVLDIFNSRELSHLGRPPHTGRPCHEAERFSNRTTRPSCHLEVLKAATCNECDAPLTMSA